MRERIHMFMQACVPFPVELTDTQRESIYEQLACHARWGKTPVQGGRTWDYEANRPSIGLAAALGVFPTDPPDHDCNW